MRARKTRKITHRVSSVTNGFVQAILPDAAPDPDEQAEVLAILSIDANAMTCAYCGSSAQQWDHLNPYVKNKRPTGYVNTANNLVPACGPCNASKSGQDWKTWMLGSARGSPSTRGVGDVASRLAKLDELVAITCLKPLAIAELVPPDLWASYWSRRDEIEALLFEAQQQAETIKRHLSAAIKG